MNAYEEKQVKRKARLEARAAALSQAANQTFERARSLGSVIPLGQPILVGHHSERSDRNYRQRISNTYARSFALKDSADKAADRAASVGSGGISSDDPEAIAKLKEQIAAAKKSQDIMVASNKAIRMHKTSEAQLAALVALGHPEAIAQQLLQPDFAQRIGFPSYALQNNNANIRRLELRVAELTKKSEQQDVEIVCNGYTYREDIADNRIQFLFAGKPDAATRDLLKKAAFKWSPSRGAWVRQLTNSARWSAKEVRQALDAAEQSTPVEPI